MIAKCIDTAAAAGMHRGGRLALSHQGKSVLAEVMPLRDDGLPDAEGIRGAAVFLINPELAMVVSMDGLAMIFGLTASEAAVADALAAGHRIPEIADLRGTAVETVRKQVKAVLSKTGSSSQLDLLRLAAR